jgi:hypothetical protein
MAMTTEGLSWRGIGVRFVLALVLVYATWNPTGVSFTHWALYPILGQGDGVASAQLPLKFLAAVLLIAGWVLYLQATRRSLGIPGAILVTAICAGVVWLLSSWDLFSLQGQAISHVVLVILAMILAMGMSWSHLSRSLSGQVDTDTVD